jgi:hypothetical protein
MRKTDGRKAEVVDAGERYDTYIAFAEKYDYPDAAHDWRGGFRDRRTTLKKGDVVTLLTSGPHTDRPQEGTLWIVEAANGERHIIGEKGLRILSEEVANITVLKDESLGGIEREYREVKRKATVGERIKIVNNGANHGLEIGYICTADNADGAEGWALYHAEERAEPDYVVLEPTDIIRLVSEGHIDNERLRMVDRKAAVGERVIALESCSVNPRNYGPGAVFEVEAHDYFGVDITDFNGEDNVIPHSEYRVLEPVETAQLSAQPPLDQAAANISALQAQVSGLEAKVAELVAQVRTVIESANPAELSMSVNDVASAVKVVEGPADDMPPSFAIPRKSGKSLPLSAIKPRAKSPQEIRDEIVERAKADVKALAENGRTQIRYSNTNRATCYVKFYVDRDKREVTAVLIGVGSGKIRAIGRAICAPNDVFNAHIGRAIALRKALGLEIPAEYLNVPNPEEPRVGDVVDEIGGLNRKGRVVREMRPRGFGLADKGLTFVGGGWAFIRDCRIIEDSREEVGA